MTLGMGWRLFVAAGGTRRQMIGTALAGLILGLGSVTVGTTFVQAAERDSLLGFFEALFNSPKQEAPVAPPPQPRRYSSLPDARHIREKPLLQRARSLAALRGTGVMRRRLGERRQQTAVRGSPPGTRTVCMRMCDGFLFPLGNLASKADLPVHEASCASACPGSETRLLTLAPGETDLDRAVGLNGQPYRASALANVYRERRVANCSCQPAEGAEPLSLVRDLTLRRGDVVATAESAEVVTRVGNGRVALKDFRIAKGLSRSSSRQIEARVGTLQREEQARAFRRALRAIERERIVQVASAGPGFPLVARAERRAEFAAVRVVTPSPFVR